MPYEVQRLFLGAFGGHVWWRWSCANECQQLLGQIAPLGRPGVEHARVDHLIVQSSSSNDGLPCQCMASRKQHRQRLEPNQLMPHSMRQPARAADAAKRDVQLARHQCRDGVA